MEIVSYQLIRVKNKKNNTKEHRCKMWMFIIATTVRMLRPILTEGGRITNTGVIVPFAAGEIAMVSGVPIVIEIRTILVVWIRLTVGLWILVTASVHILPAMKHKHSF